MACAGCAVDNGAGAGGVTDGACEPFVVGVVSFVPGAGAGFGVEQLPEIVQGPPTAETDSSGSIDVVSLGEGGVIELEMGCPAHDAEGVDFIVYENAFFLGARVFAEPGEVAVSADGKDWVTFPCTPSSSFDDGIDGCAGTAPVRANDRNGLAGDLENGGGDGFDLATLGVATAQFVRITDRGGAGAGGSVGFDLDAIAVVVR